MVGDLRELGPRWLALREVEIELAANRNVRERGPCPRSYIGERLGYRVPDLPPRVPFACRPGQADRALRLPERTACAKSAETSARNLLAESGLGSVLAGGP